MNNTITTKYKCMPAVECEHINSCKDFPFKCSYCKKNKLTKQSYFEPVDIDTYKITYKTQPFQDVQEFIFKEE